jgi:hypothetical protein
MSDYCEEYNSECRTVPEFDKVKLIIKNDGKGQGWCYCPLCNWVKWAYNCPYIPVDL